MPTGPDRPEAVGADDALRVSASPGRRLVGNALILLGGKTVNALLALAYTAIAVRTLGVEGFGILILVHAYVLAVAEIAKFQSWQAVLRYGTPALRRGDRDAFRMLVTFTLLLDGASALAAVAIAAAAAALVAPLVGVPGDLVPAVMVYAIAAMFMVSATANGLLRLFDRFDLLAAQSAVGGLVRLVGSAAAALAGGGVTAFLGVWFASAAVAGLVLFACAWREAHRRGLARLGGPVSGIARIHPGIWGFVWTTNLNTTLALAGSHVATLVVGGLLGPGAAGLYRIARQVAEAAARPVKALVPAIYPELARMSAAGAVAAMRRLVGQSLLVSGLACLVLFGLIALAGPLVLRLIMGADSGAAYAAMLLLAVAALLTLWTFPLEPLLISVGAARRALDVRLAATLVQLALLPPGLLLWGLPGAGMAAIAAALVALAGQARAVRRWFHAPSRRAFRPEGETGIERPLD